MKKLMSLFLALLMVFTLLPVSVLADNDAEGDPSAETMTQTAEDMQPEPEEDPTENSGETPEKKAEENPEDETAETGLIAFLGADSRDETFAYHYRVETAAGETVTLAPQPDYTDVSALSYVWARFDAEQDAYIELPEETGAVLTLTAAAEEIGAEKLYACTVTAPDAAGTAVFTLAEKAPTAENEPEAEEQTAEENTPVLLAVSSVPANTSNTTAQYSSDWVYWSQGASKYSGMRSYGCRVVAYSKLIREAGYALSSPDALFEWGKGTYFDAGTTSEVTSVGIPPQKYIEEKGGTLTKVGSVRLENKNSQDAETVYDLIKQGYYVVLIGSAHTAYVGRSASLSAGKAMILDSWNTWSSHPNTTQAYSTYSNTTFNSAYYFTVTSATKPTLSKDISVADYKTYYAESVEAFYGPAKPKSGTVSGYRLPTTLSDTVKIEKTYTGTMTLVNKIVNHAGNTWYETSDGCFVWSGSITIQTAPSISNISPNSGAGSVGNKPKISFSVGWVSSNKPLSWTLEYGTDESMSTKPHSEDFTDTVLASNNPVPCSVQFGTEEPALRYNTTYYYRIVIKPTSGADVKTEIRSFSTGACNNHNLDSGTVTKQPTCSATGVKTFTCTNPGCTHTETKTIAATGNHTWNSGSVTKQPTCSATGVKTYKCTNSGCTATKTETVAATGKHTWNSGSITTQPTCVAAGVKTYKCTTSGCTATKTESVAATGNHTWDAGTVTTPATPGKAGVKTYTCTVCKQTKTESIAALPMTYTVSYDANGGSGAPASQTKTQDVALTLSGTRPTRDGYTFLGWATSKTASSAQYQPGDTYTANAAATLYAVWEKNAPSIEERLRAAIANGKSQFDIPGDCTLSADLVVPDGFNLYVDQGTLTIPNGVTLTVEPEGFLGSRADTVVQSGGKIVNNGTLNSFMGGSITVDNGGTMENNRSFIVFGGGSFHNRGTYTLGENGYLNFEITEGDYKTDLTGVDLKLVLLECWSGREEDIRKLFAEAGNVQYVSAQISEISEATELTLSADLTIPENGGISIGGNAVVTVPQGKTLTNNGDIYLYENGRLVIESGAKLVNNNYVTAWDPAEVTVAGTFDNHAWVYVEVDSWNCSGTLLESEGNVTLYKDAATAAELEEALKSGANTVNVTKDIVADRSLTVPEGVQLSVDPDVKLTVPAPYALNNRGTITVAGALDIGGSFSGNRVLVFDSGTLTPSSIPHGSGGVLAKSIEISGADTLLPGGEAEYTARITPDNAWISWAYWTIVSGDELASISYDGVLTAGDTPGTVTIRAEALDDSGVYAEKTVTIQKAEPEYETKLTVSTATASQGKEVALDIAIEGNPGVIGISFQINYDKTRLKLTGYTDGAMKDWSVSVGKGEKAVWLDETAGVINGNILTLKFQILDDAPDGLASVTLTGFKASTLDETAVDATVFAGGITVTSRIPGDVNDDGEVDIFDCVRLKKYIAGFDVTINEANADVNGDGEIDIFDCVRLKKYLAGFDVELK